MLHLPLFTRKGVYGIKQKNWTPSLNSAYSNWSTKFQLKLTILIFWIKFSPKRVFSIKNRKSEHHHWIMHIQISLGTKFQLKLTILIFWTKFVQKGRFQCKNSSANEVVVGLLSFLIVRILDTINMVLLFFQLKLKVAVHAARTRRKFLKWATFDNFLRKVDFIFMFFQEELASFVSTGEHFSSNLES